MEYQEPMPVTCPSQHPVGRQNPLYEGTTATGWFDCEVCRLQYLPLPHGQEACDMDGHTEDTYGGEHYWHCEDLAVYQVRMPENHAGDVISGTVEMRLCETHLEEVIFE